MTVVEMTEKTLETRSTFSVMFEMKASIPKNRDMFCFALSYDIIG